MVFMVVEFICASKMMQLFLFNYFNRKAKVPSTGKIETETESKIGEDVNGLNQHHYPYVLQYYYL